MIQKYWIQYWFSENLETIQISVDISPAKILQHKMYDLKPDTMYYFKVQAYNEVGAGPYTKFINLSTTNENPVPLLLLYSLSGMDVLDIDLQIQFVLNENYNYIGIVYSALKYKIYGITRKMELMIWDLNLSAIATKPNFTKIVDLDGLPRSLCIDWVARNLYWIEYKTRTIMKLDLTLLQMGIVKYDKIRKTDWPLSNLNVLPSKGYLYWSEHNFETMHIMQSDLDGKNMKPLSNIENNECSCLFKESILSLIKGI
ncbi:unnamed protein product [Lasius platythorax]|uniref:Fibronectin type-III domain-containing protein n=1 Tax=Lasius platythorax TaxID=488582 RepID=A0AAV2NZG8_9HYME